MQTTKLNTDKVVQFLSTTIRGKTAAQVANRFGTTRGTAGRFLNSLVNENQIVQGGQTKTGQRGRPATFYKTIGNVFQ